MNPESESLIERSTRELAGNPELHLAARSMLAARLESAGATPPQIAEASESLKAADGSRLRRHWRKGLLLMALLVGLAGIAGAYRQWNELAWVRESLGFFSPSAVVETPQATGLTPAQNLLLYGAPGAVTEMERWKPLWQSDPRNPAFLAQYAAACFAEHGKLPQEALDAAADVDPYNGWYQALAAASILDGAIVRESQSSAERKAFKTPVFTIKDEARLRKGLNLIQQAAHKPDFNSHGKELIAMRVPLLGKRDDLASSLSALGYTTRISIQSVHFRRFADAFSAAAAKLATEGDKEGLRKLAADHEAITRKVTMDGWTLVEALISKSLLVSPSRNLRDAAQSLGDTDLHARYSSLADWELADRTRREGRGHRPAASELIDRKGSLLTSLTMPMIARQVKSPPPLNDEDLSPFRHAEHALILRVLSSAAFVLFALAAGAAACQRYFTSPLVHTLSKRMTHLITPRDWWIVLTAGPLIPIAWYAVILYQTPLSSREWALHGPAGFMIFAQAGALLILMLVFPLVLAAARLDRRGAVFAMKARSPRWRGFATACGFLAIPALGATLPALHVMKLPNAALFALLGTATGLAAVPLLWLLAGFLQPVLGTRDGTLRLATLNRMAAPAWAAGMLALAACTFLLHAEERRAIARDRMFRITADSPAITRFEWDITQILRDELLGLMR